MGVPSCFEVSWDPTVCRYPFFLCVRKRRHLSGLLLPVSLTQVMSATSTAAGGSRAHSLLGQSLGLWSSLEFRIPNPQ